MSSATSALNTVLVTGIHCPDRISSLFAEVIHAPRRAPAPDADLLRADVIYGHLPPNLHHAPQVPRLKFVQLPAAGADVDLKPPLWREGAGSAIKLATAAGVHSACIPQVCPFYTSRDMVLTLSEAVLYSDDARAVP